MCVDAYERVRDNVLNMMNLTVEKLLARIVLEKSLNDLAAEVAREFYLGSVLSIAPMLVGYEEVNAKLVTGMGEYVVKIFSKQKDIETIRSNVRALISFYEGNVPVPALFASSSHEYLYRINQKADTYLIVMEYFAGKKFIEITPTINDILQITEYISRIHAVSFDSHPTYDMWLTQYLPQEYDAKRKYLDLQDQHYVDSIVSLMKKIDISKLSTSTVHLDLHRENVMKSTDGKYCILDLATATHGYTLFDIATFIGLFCLDASHTLKDNREIYNKVIAQYQQFRSLTQYELESLPTLVMATFASNFLIATYVQKAGIDENPEQTLYYQSIGKNGILSFKDSFALS